MVETPRWRPLSSLPHAPGSRFHPLAPLAVRLENDENENDDSGSSPRDCLDQNRVTRLASRVAGNAPNAWLEIKAAI